MKVSIANRTKKMPKPARRYAKMPETAPRYAELPQPAPYYAEFATTCRAMGVNIANDDYEKIDDIVAGNSLGRDCPCPLGFISPRPLEHYAEIAAICRDMALDSAYDIKDDDYDKIDTLIEGGGLRTTTVQARRNDNAAEALVRGYLPYEAKQLAVN